MTKWSIYPEDIILLNVYVSISQTPERMKRLLIELQWEIDITITFWDFNKIPIIIDGTNTYKISKTILTNLPTVVCIELYT